MRRTPAKLAEEDGVRYLSSDELAALIAKRDSQAVFLVDVRTDKEFTDGHIPGFRWWPGGQAVQRADDLAVVKNATLVFCCDGRTRATVTASFYRQMGHQGGLCPGRRCPRLGLFRPRIG